MIQEITEKNLSSFLDTVLSLPVFKDKTVKERSKKLLYILFDELYNENPKSLNNFLQQNLDEKSLNELENSSDSNNTIDYFINYSIIRYGIKLDDIKDIRISTKVRLLGFINKLIATKGTKETLIIFSNIIKEFLGTCNIYNISVEQSESKYLDPEIRFIQSDNNQNKYFYNYYLTKINLDDCIISENNYLIDPSGYFYNIVESSLNYKEPISIQMNEAIIKLEYAMDPIHISDENNIINNISLKEIKHPRFLMQLDQFLQESNIVDSTNNNSSNYYNNLNKYNIFPINTNLIFMQYTQNTQNFNKDGNVLNDLIFRKANISMIKSSNSLFKIRLANQLYELELKELYYLLAYVKLREIHTDKDSTKVDFILKSYSSFYYNYVDENTINYDYNSINNLIDDYKNLKTKKEFNDFIFKFNQTVLPNNKIDNLNNLLTLSKYLKNNTIESIEDLLEYINSNSIFTEPNFNNTIIDIIDTFNINSINMLYIKLEELFQSEFENLLYHVTDNSSSNLKFARIMNIIDLIIDGTVDFYDYKKYYNNSIIIYTELQNQINSQLTKINYEEKRFFFDTIFSNLIIGNEYHKLYLNPIMNLFKKYFFNGELIIKESSFNGIFIKDKTQDIYIDDINSTNVTSGNVDDITVEDCYNISIFDSLLPEDEFFVNSCNRTNSLGSKYDLEYKAGLETSLDVCVNIVGESNIMESVDFFTMIDYNLDSSYEKIYNYNISLITEKGLKVNTNEDVTIELKLVPVTWDDPIFEENDIILTENDTNKLATQDDLNDWYTDFSGTLTENIDNFNFNLLIPDDGITEEKEYVVLESTSILNNEYEETLAQFDTITHSRKLLYIGDIHIALLKLEGPDMKSVPLATENNPITYSIHLEDQNNNKITSTDNITINVTVDKNILDYNITLDDGSIIDLDDAIESNDVEDINISVMIPAGTNKVEFDIIPIKDDLKEREYFKVKMDHTFNNEFDILIASNHIFYGLEDIQKIHFIPKPDNIVVNEGNEVNIDIEVIENDIILTDPENLFVDITYEIHFITASADDIIIANSINDSGIIKKTIVNNLNDNLKINIVDDILIENIETLKVKITEVKINSEHDYNLITFEDALISIVSPLEVFLIIDGPNEITETENTYIIRVKDINGNSVILEEDLILNLEIVYSKEDNTYGIVDGSDFDESFNKFKTITIPKGTSAVEVILPTIEDNILETKEQLKLTIINYNSTGTQFSNIVLDELLITITDEYNIIFEPDASVYYNYDPSIEYGCENNQTFEVRLFDTFSETYVIPNEDFIISYNDVEYIWKAGDISVELPTNNNISIIQNSDLKFLAYTILTSGIPNISKTIPNLNLNITNFIISGPTEIIENIENDISTPYEYTLTSDTTFDEDIDIIVEVIHNTTDSNDFNDTIFLLNLPAGSSTIDFTLNVKTDTIFETSESFSLSGRFPCNNDSVNTISNKLDVIITQPIVNQVNINAPEVLYENVILMHDLGYPDASNDDIIFNLKDSEGNEITFGDEITLDVEIIPKVNDTTSSADFQSPFNTMTFQVVIPINTSSVSFDTTTFILKDSTAIKETVERFELKVSNISFLSTSNNTFNDEILVSGNTDTVEIISPPGIFGVHVYGKDLIDENWSTPYEYNLFLKTPSGGPWNNVDPNVAVRFRLSLIGYDFLPDSTNTEKAKIGIASNYDTFFSTTDEHLLDSYSNSDINVDDIITYSTENDTDDIYSISNYYQIRPGQKDMYFYLNTSGKTTNDTKVRYLKITVDDFKVISLTGNQDDIDASIYESFINKMVGGEFWIAVKDESVSFNDTDIELTTVTNHNNIT